MYRAIVRKPSKSYIHAINDWFVREGYAHEKIDFQKTCVQHEEYVKKLHDCHVDVIELAGDDRFPDGVFTQDPVLVFGKDVLVLRMFAESRQGEEEAMIEALSKDDYKIQYMTHGYCDGGDVMVAEDIKHVWIGNSARTDKAGFEEVKKFYVQFGFSVESIDVTKCLHLMTGVCYLKDKTLLITDMIDKSYFDGYTCLHVDETQKYAVNFLVIGNSVIMAEGYPVVQKMIQDQGFHVMTTPMSEFQKADGGITCLSNTFAY